MWRSPSAYLSLTKQPCWQSPTRGRRSAGTWRKMASQLQGSKSCLYAGWQESFSFDIAIKFVDLQFGGKSNQPKKCRRLNSLSFLDCLITPKRYKISKNHVHVVDLLESAILLIPHMQRSVLSARRSLMTKLAEILFYRYVDRYNIYERPKWTNHSRLRKRLDRF